MRPVRFQSISMLLILLVIAVGCSDDNGGNGPAPEDTNRVWVDRVTANTDNPYVRVDVWFENIDSIFAIEVPLHVSGSGFTIDSVSFVGSRVSELLILEGVVDNQARTIDLVVLPDTANIGPGEGLLAGLYFTLIEESRGQVLVIDTTTIGDRYLRYLDPTGFGDILPDFTSGEISVLY